MSILCESCFLFFWKSAPFLERIGIIGGLWFLSRAHWTVLKNGWFFTSEAPNFEPNLLFSSLVRSFLIKFLQFDEMDWESGNVTSDFKIFENVWFLLEPLNGVVPQIIS
ncbi:hypothetical protein WICPIJ_000919 [Wickerhamomyces pijperi]|uniref:Uncharacterized protein n=1 Tax=Wickerhamomyces pijperi TaxID=599730 RepID=A0A9P8QES5_WICPI|nr:hypothetical protein WICPIJ_000919 [Wickerhamomyces pijperi]